MKLIILLFLLYLKCIMFNYNLLNYFYQLCSRTDLSYSDNVIMIVLGHGSSDHG